MSINNELICGALSNRPAPKRNVIDNVELINNNGAFVIKKTKIVELEETVDINKINNIINEIENKKQLLLLEIENLNNEKLKYEDYLLQIKKDK